MTGSTNAQLAVADRESEVDPKLAADAIQERAAGRARYHSPILTIARPILRDLICENAAALMEGSRETKLDLLTLIGAIAMALDDARLAVTLEARIARIRSTAATGVAAEMEKTGGESHASARPLNG